MLKGQGNWEARIFWHNDSKGKEIAGWEIEKQEYIGLKYRKGKKRKLLEWKLRSKNMYEIIIGKERKLLEGKLRSKNIYGLKVGKERKLIRGEIEKQEYKA